MQNQIQIFEHKEFGKLEMLTLDGKPYFPAVECAGILGYSKPHNAISRHCAHSLKRGVVTQTTNQHGATSNQTVEKIYIPEGDLYRLIIRSKLPEAVRFEAWVCDTVLPSIRRHGAYITDETLRRMRQDSVFADELIRRLTDERAKSSALLDYVERIAPKARYYDIILQCPNAVQVSIIAKDYGYSAVKFNKLLHALGVQYKVGRTWLLYREYDDKGYAVSKTYDIQGKATAILTCFTQRGRFWLYALLKCHGILPLAERDADS